MVFYYITLIKKNKYLERVVHNPDKTEWQSLSFFQSKANLSVTKMLKRPIMTIISFSLWNICVNFQKIFPSCDWFWKIIPLQCWFQLLNYLHVLLLHLKQSIKGHSLFKRTIQIYGRIRFFLVNTGTEIFVSPWKQMKNQSLKELVFFSLTSDYISFSTFL